MATLPTGAVVLLPLFYVSRPYSLRRRWRLKFPLLLPQPLPGTKANPGLSTRPLPHHSYHHDQLNNRHGPQLKLQTRPSYIEAASELQCSYACLGEHQWLAPCTIQVLCCGMPPMSPYGHLPGDQDHRLVGSCSPTPPSFLTGALPPHHSPLSTTPPFSLTSPTFRLICFSVYIRVRAPLSLSPTPFISHICHQKVSHRTI